MRSAASWRRDTAHWWNEGPFLYVGRLDPSKGVPQIISAWLRLKSRYGGACPDLWLAGGTPGEIEAVRARAPRPGSLETQERAGRVRWWGYLDEPGLSALLLKARALIMHSAYEPGGRVVLEALSQGVPVIATPFGFAQDLVRDWVSGFLVPHGDLRSLVRRMEHFIRQPLLGPSLGLAARHSAHRALESWDFYRTHGAIYRNVAQRAEPGHVAAPAARDVVIVDPAPRGLVERYPFPAALPTLEQARGAASRLLGATADEIPIRPLPAAGGAVRWSVETEAGQFRLTHLYSVYAERPLWDRASMGAYFEPGRERRRRAALASALPGFESLRCDDGDEFHLAPESSPVPDERALVEGAAAFEALWRVSVPQEQTHLLRERAETWWSGRAARPWRHDPIEAADLRPASLRAAWSELVDKLAQRDIAAGASIAAAFADTAEAAETLVAQEDRIAPFCFQHGAVRPGTVRVGRDGTRLSGGDCLTPGWWGRDLAQLLLYSTGPAASPDRLEAAIGQYCLDPDCRRHVALWIAIEMTEQIARSVTVGAAPPASARGVEQLLALSVGRI